MTSPFRTVLGCTLMTLFLACDSRDEEEAGRLVQSARASVASDRAGAINLAETILLRYPKTDAAEEVRSLLPMWLHAEALVSMIHDFQRFDPSLGSASRPTWDNSIGTLVRILEDFPEYRYREPLEAQIAALVLLREMLPALLRIQEKVIHWQQASQEAVSAVSTDRHKEQLAILRSVAIDQSEEASRVFSRCADGLRTLRREHGLSSTFSEVADAYEELSDFYDEYGRASGVLLDPEVFECRVLLFTPPDGLIDRVFTAWKRSRCESKISEVAELQVELEDKQIKASGRLSALLERADDITEEYFAEADLKPLLEQFEVFLKSPVPQSTVGE